MRMTSSSLAAAGWTTRKQQAVELLDDSLTMGGDGDKGL
jgi:hypothetical protein